VSNFDTFDNLDDTGTTEAVIPFQFREDKTKDGTLEWLNKRFGRVYEGSFARFLMYRRYINMYKNVAEDSGDGLTKTSSRNSPSGSRKPKMRDNIIWDLVDQKVAEISKSTTKVAFIPQSYFDQDDMNNSKACKILCQSRMEDMKFDRIMTKMDRVMFLTGHTISEVCWNPDIGPFNKGYEEKKKAYAGKVPKTDEQGVVMEGKFLEDEEMRLGDVELKPLLPWYCFPEETKKSIKDCDYFETIEWVFKEKYVADYPKMKDKVKANSHVLWDMSASDLSIPENMVLKRIFWHKPTKYFTEGCKITYSEDGIAEWIDFPYEDKELPFVEDKDIECLDEFWGRPFIINIEQFYRMNNSIWSGMARTHGVLNAPKYVYPEGTVDKQSLNNEFGAIAYRGGVPPTVLQHNYVNRGEIELSEGISGRAGKLARLFDISRGVVPSGVTAAQAMRLLEDQQFQAMSVTSENRKQRVLDLYRKIVLRMAQYYSAEDGRMSRILGSNNTYLMNSFKKFDFNLIYDIRIENDTVISGSRAGRMADIVDLNTANQMDPLFGKKEMIKILGLNLTEAFQDEATYSIDTAKQCLDMILNGEQPPAPEPTDGLAEFYGVFSRFVESPEYKFVIRPETKTMIMDFIMALEMLSFERSIKNPSFATEMSLYTKYPMVFTPPAVTPMQNPAVSQPMNPEQKGTPSSSGDFSNKAKQAEADIKTQGEIL
jgi:hypothetical protein